MQKIELAQDISHFDRISMQSVSCLLSRAYRAIWMDWIPSADRGRAAKAFCLAGSVNGDGRAIDCRVEWYRPDVPRWHYLEHVDVCTKGKFHAL